MDLGQQEALFRSWLAEHAGLLWKVVRSFSNGPSDADDLWQEIVLQVWISIPRFREQCSATTWLYRVALNTAMVWKRREHKHRGRSQPLEELPEIAGGGEASTEDAAAEQVERLYAAIRALAPAKRALVLLYLDGLSYGEMSEVTGISESNVGVRLNRIKKELAEKLKVPTNVA